jgi:hypothetical protein
MSEKEKDLLEKGNLFAERGMIISFLVLIVGFISSAYFYLNLDLYKSHTLTEVCLNDFIFILLLTTFVGSLIYLKKNLKKSSSE